MEKRPLCFVLMPFGTKPDATGGNPIDFNRIYETAIRPGIEAAGLAPIRADEERSGGIIHKAMFERLLLCRYAVADLTTGNPNVFYELGVRHAVRPRTTVALCASHQPMSFDLNHLRGLRYDLGEHNAFAAAEAEALREALTQTLRGLIEEQSSDSPLFQLLRGWQVPSMERLEAETFRHRERRRAEWHRRIHMARTQAAVPDQRESSTASLQEVRAELGALDVDEVGVILDLLHAHQSLEDWDSMIALCRDLPSDLADQARLRQLLAFALNRRAEANGSEPDRAEALEILSALEAEQGASAETCGLIGRIHKARWMDARAAAAPQAPAQLRRAIDAYRRGFEADWRAVYPGVNLVTLLTVKGDETARGLLERLVPIVRYAAERRVAGADPGYWDHASALEVAVVAGEDEAAREHLSEALAAEPAPWQCASTRGNLELIRDGWREQGRETGWLEELIHHLAGPATSGG